MKSLSIILLFLGFCPLAQAQTEGNTVAKNFVAPDHPEYYCVTVKDLQIALTQKGYPVKADNVFGKKTKKAFIQFAMDKGLPSGNRWGYFSEAMPALGIEPCLR
jgi:hypothetical protein